MIDLAAPGGGMDMKKLNPDTPDSFVPSANLVTGFWVAGLLGELRERES